MQIDNKNTKARTIIDFTQTGLKELIVLGKYNYNRTEPKLEDHVHENMIEICYYDKGSQWFAVEKNKYLVRGGDVFIHFPGEVHGSGGHPEAKGRLYWFILKIPSKSSTTASETHTGYLIKELIKLQRRHFRGSIIIKQMLEEIFTAAKAKDENKKIQHLRINLFTQVLLLKLIEFANQKTNNTDNERLQKVYSLIDANLTDNISIPYLAKEINLSESHFKNWFKKMSGFTPIDYVQRKRVDYALKKMKEDNSLSLKDLAYDLNFSSQQYFTTVIKKFTGKSPKEFKGYPS